MPGGRGAAPKTIDAYLERLPPDARGPLERLRATIRAAAPRAEEVISYRIPAFRQDGLLVFFAAFRDHLSFFPGSVVTARRFARELRPFAAGKGTFRFTAEHPIPPSLVRRIVRARVAENAGRRAPARRTARRPRASGHRVRTKA